MAQEGRRVRQEKLEMSFFESTTEKNVEIYGKRIGICAFCRNFSKIHLKIVKNDVQDICHVLY
mgnify:FL=1